MAMKNLLGVLVLIVLLVWLGISGTEVGDWIGDFFQGLRPDTK